MTRMKKFNERRAESRNYVQLSLGFCSFNDIEIRNKMFSGWFLFCLFGSKSKICDLKRVI
ncbi:hypothetical protein YC2023_109943 [Brassica napus]